MGAALAGALQLGAICAGDFVRFFLPAISGFLALNHPLWFCPAADGGDGSMGVLRIITETGMFHSAAKVTVRNLSKWYGFKPIVHRSFKGPGFVDNSDRSSDERYWATFNIDDAVLEAAVTKAVAKYRTAWYCVGWRDCVSFTADLCDDAGMTVAIANWSPAGFLEYLKLTNTPTGSGRTSKNW